MLDCFDLTGKVALVTGGSQSIGKEIAKALARSGAKVAILARTESRLIEACKEIQALGAECMWVKADISDEDSVKKAVDEVAEKYGTIDILIDNAAGSAPAIPVETLDLETWKKCMATNVDGMFITAKAVANRCMIPRKQGRIVVLCSIASRVFRAGSFTGAYETSKGAVEAMVRVLDSNWNRYGISVNGIAPGYIMSDIVKEMFEREPELEKLALAQIPVGRFADPAEMAPVAVFLASEGASYLNGTVITADGGRTYY